MAILKIELFIYFIFYLLTPKIEIRHRYLLDKNYQKQSKVSALAFTFALLHLQHLVFKIVKVLSYIPQKL